jgi:hypothetical protein
MFNIKTYDDVQFYKFERHHCHRHYHQNYHRSPSHLYSFYNYHQNKPIYINYNLKCLNYKQCFNYEDVRYVIFILPFRLGN